MAIRRDRSWLAGVMLTVGLPVCAQQPTNIPDLSWGYVRIDPAGSGSFDGLTAEFTPAKLADGFSLPPSGRRLPEVTRENGALVVSEGRCDGPPGIEPNSAGFWYIQTPDEVMILSEYAASTRNTAQRRRIYLDGRPHPDLANWTPTGAGHSIGWYENGDLIVETIGLTEGAVTAGGYKTPETRLTERFHMLPEDRMMTITFTWEDPKIYAAPHSYTFYLERLPEDATAFEGWCDSGDPESRYSVAPPEQD